jgi:pimeloyl-ACP methyl ester carboxylesterase
MQVFGVARLLAAVLTAGFCVGVPPALSQSAVVTDLPLPGGGSERVLYIPAPQPSAVVILLDGGSGLIRIDDAGIITPGDNFLVRTRHLWAAEGFAVVVPGPPNGASLLGQRRLPDYVEALDQVVDYARSLAASVWIIGTSQGATGAVSGGVHLGGKIVGVVMISPVTLPSRSDETVFDAAPASITVPALVVSNAGDICPVTPPEGAARLLAALTQSPRKELMTVESTWIEGKPCTGLAPHGYLGIETSVVQRIAAWIKDVAGR